MVFVFIVGTLKVHITTGESRKAEISFITTTGGRQSHCDITNKFVVFCCLNFSITAFAILFFGEEEVRGEL